MFDGETPATEPETTPEVPVVTPAEGEKEEVAA